jgi:hypothetical protein
MQPWFNCNVAYTLDNVYTISECILDSAARFSRSNPAQMCGRVACSADASSVQRATGATRTVGTYRISYNLSPGQNAPVVYSGRDGARTLHAMKWGLVRVP